MCDFFACVNDVKLHFSALLQKKYSCISMHAIVYKRKHK